MGARSEKASTFGCQGGIDLASPALNIPPGRALVLYNYEVTRKGYRRLDGYERFDGRPRPHEASYWEIPFDLGTTAIVAGNIVEDGTTGATAEVLIVNVTSGSWATNDAAGTLVVFNMAGGTFNDNNAIEVSSVQRATVDGATSQNSAADDATHNTYKQAAIEATRTDINAIPGAGPVRGVWAYDDAVYAFRDNVGQTQCIMHEATAAGWSTVNLGKTLAFALGTAAIVVGDTITGGTSGATAVVGVVEVDSGDWSTNDAAGTLTLHTVSGTFQSETITSSPSSGSATISGDAVAQTLSPGGSYEFKNENFIGSDGADKMYGVSGVHKAFEFDGSTFYLITTGLTTDTPEHLATHRSRLVLTYISSMMLSVVSQPTNFNGASGAGEFALGSQISAVKSLPGGVLGAWTDVSVQLLYGSSSTDWELKPNTEDVGAYAGTVQPVGDYFFLSARGITSLKASQQFGDFEHATISQLVDPFLDQYRDAVLFGSRSREKNQYRLFFSTDDSSGTRLLFTRFEGNGLLGFSTGKYLFNMTCATNGDILQKERMFAGADDGYVYELDVGTSYDGSAVESLIRLPFNHLKSPTQRKRWMRLEMVLEALDEIDLQLQQELDWGAPDTEAPSTEELSVQGGGGSWNRSNWNEFYWATALAGLVRVKLYGRGVSTGVVIYGSHTYEAPYTIEAATIHYLPGRREH